MNLPHFAWDEWYEAVGGRSIRIEEAQDILKAIYDEQYPRFDGPVADKCKVFNSPEEAGAAVRDAARGAGADIVGICRIEPADIYQGK